MSSQCFLRCEPTEEDRENEKFYIFIDPTTQLVIYGHTIDRHTLEKFPEDIPTIRQARIRGFEMGCWHSTACPDGEYGANRKDLLKRITFDEWNNARGMRWPQLADPSVRLFMSLVAARNGG